MSAAPPVRLATLWQRKSAKGKTYFSGFIGDAQLLMFRGEEITRDNGEVVQTWRLLIQEREPRPAGQRGDRARRDPTPEEKARARVPAVLDAQAPARPGSDGWRVPGPSETPFFDDTELEISDLDAAGGDGR